MSGENTEQKKAEGRVEEIWTPEDETRIKEYESKREQIEAEIRKMGEFMDLDEEKGKKEYYLDWLNELYADVLEKRKRIAVTERERGQIRELGESAKQIREFEERMRIIIEGR